MWRDHRYRQALDDLRRGLLAFELWAYLGWHDIRQRYRRSLLGPIWLTLSTAIFVSAIGFLYAKFFGQPVGEFLPFVAIGFIVWILLQTSVTEACVVFVESESVIKQIKLPFSVHVSRMLCRNFVIFLHNLLIVPVVLLATGKSITWSVLVLPISLLLLAWNCFWIGLVLATVCARFRDIPPLVGSVMQLVFFLSPVIWLPAILGNRGWIATYNPVHHLMDLIRAPVLEGRIPWDSLAVALAIALAGSAVSFAVFAHFRHRLAYWI